MTKYKILYWQGIPSQVRASDENGRINRPLPQRFQEAIDSAAMALGKSGSDSYTDGFHWGEEIEHPGSAEEAADAIAAELDKKYPSIDWRSLIKKIENNK
jgi:Virulence factor